MSADADLVFCKRARRWGKPPENVTYGGALGEEIRNNVIAESWQEWVAMEVMVINELRLDFMDPKSQDVLVKHLREFLALDQEVEPTPR
ncbi:MAG: Fe(2+)-trafficking protein [Acidobacteriota bacterium]